MARPQQVSDEQILAAAMECIVKIGPAPTFAEVGERIGISGPAINRRMGPKRALLLRRIERWADRIPHVFDSNEEDDPVGRLRRGLTHMEGLGETPHEVINVKSAL